MAKIKLESIGADTFAVAGKVYTKGDYMISYNEDSVDATGVVATGTDVLVTLKDKNGNEVFKNVNYTNFVNSSGNTFGSFSAFSLALSALIVKGSGAAPYAVYAANLTQTSTSAPTAVVAKTDLAAITYAYTSEGLYTGTVAAANLTAGKTIITVGGNVKAKVTSTTTFTLTTTDGYLDATAVKIEVYL